MTINKCASARSQSRARKREAALLDVLETHVASMAVTGLVDHLRTIEFSDGYVSAALKAFQKDMPTTVIKALREAKQRGMV